MEDIKGKVTISLEDYNKYKDIFDALKNDETVVLYHNTFGYNIFTNSKYILSQMKLNTILAQENNSLREQIEQLKKQKPSFRNLFNFIK